MGQERRQVQQHECRSELHIDVVYALELYMGSDGFVLIAQLHCLLDLYIGHLSTAPDVLIEETKLRLCCIG